MEPFTPSNEKDKYGRLILDDRLEEIKKLDVIINNLKVNLDNNRKEIEAIDFKRKQLVEQIIDQTIIPPPIVPMYLRTEGPSGPGPIKTNLSPQQITDASLVLIDNYIRSLPPLVYKENQTITMKKATNDFLQKKIDGLVVEYTDISNNVQIAINEKAIADATYNTKKEVINTLETNIKGHMDILAVTQSVSDNYYEMIKNIQEKMYILSNDTIHNSYDMFNAIHRQNSSLQNNIDKTDNKYFKDNQDNEYEKEMLPFFNAFNKILMFFYIVLYIFLIYLLIFVDNKFSFFVTFFVVLYIGLHPFFVIYWYQIHFPESLKFLNTV